MKEPLRSERVVALALCAVGLIAAIGFSREAVVNPLLSPLGRLDSDLTATTAQATAGFSDLVRLSEEFPGSRIIVVDQVRTVAQLAAIGAASEVSPANPEPEPSLALAQHIELSGDSNAGPWRMVARDGSATTFVLYGSDDGVLYLDARLVEVLPHLQGSGREISAPRRTGWFGAVIVEGFILAAVLISGHLLLGPSAIPSAVRQGLAFIVGLAALAATGVLLPRAGWNLVWVGVAASASAAVRSRTAGGADRLRSSILSRATAGAVLCIVGVTGTVRWFGLVRMTPDSFDVLVAARLLGTSSFGPELFDHTFYIGQQAIHAVGFALGSGPLFAAGWLVLAASVLVLMHLAAHSWVARHLPSRTIALTLVLGLSAGSPYVWRFAAYLNAHMFIAGIMLAIWMLIFVIDHEKRAGVMPVFVLFLSFILMRGEAPLVLALMLASATRRGAGLQCAALPTYWRLLALATALWSALLFWTAAVSGQAAPVTAYLGTLIALGSLAASGADSQDARFWLRRLAIASPWVALLAITAAYPELLTKGLGDAWSNMTGRSTPAGLFALVWLCLVVLVAIGAPAASQSDALHVLRGTVIGYFPVVFFARALSTVGWARTGAVPDGLADVARLGWSDSTNRIMFHLWFVLLAGFIVSPPLRERSRRAPAEGRSRAERVRLLGIFAAGGVVMASWLGGTGASGAYRALGLLFAALVFLLWIAREGEPQASDQEVRTTVAG